MVFFFSEKRLSAKFADCKDKNVEINMRINICWWNTRLTPPVGKFTNKETDEDLNKKVEEVISFICTERPLDLILLCEVHSRDEPLIKKISKKNEMEYSIISIYISGIYYDFAIMYEKTKIKIKSISPIDEGNSFRQQLRIGVIVESEFDGVDVSIFLSHWNSDMFNGGIKKSHCATRLRKKIDGHFRNEKDMLLLVGDYNSQPYEDEITIDLETTKDLEIISESPYVIYNPFWRHLDSRTSEHSYRGSYYNQSNAHDKWRTYDQMMFSHKFIHGNTWKLDTDSPEIHKELNSLSFNFLDTFDHIPIYGGLEK